MIKADWYFDFISPFAYLQNCRMDEFPSNLYINRKPLLFAGLLNYWGTKGPAELPSKRLFSYRHVQWLANKLEVPLVFPEKHPFNPITLLRLCIAANCSKKAVDSLFKCVWVEGLSGDDPKNWTRFCEAVSIPESEAIEKISSPEIKQELKLNGEEAIDTVVGTSSGQVSDAQLFASSEMKRLETLPGY